MCRIYVSATRSARGSGRYSGCVSCDWSTGDVRTIFPLLALLIAWFPLNPAGRPSASKAFELSVSPRVAFAPVDLVILVRLQPVAEDRQLRVLLNGEDYGRSSAVDLQGEQSPKFFRFEWRRVGAVDGEITGSVWTAYGKIRLATSQHVLITAPQ